MEVICGREDKDRGWERAEGKRICGAATLNMEAAGSSETLVPLYRTTYQRMQQNNNYHIDIVVKKHESGENSFFL